MTNITIDRAVVQQALEALTNCNSEHGHRCNRCDSEVDEGGKVASALRAALAQPSISQQVVDEQAEDEGLWFRAETAAEAYLQQELRRLHAAVEETK